MFKNLNEVIQTIKLTKNNHKEDLVFPYFFIVGAGISVPEIPTSKQIIEECKIIVKNNDEEYYNNCEKTSDEFKDDAMKYYSAWIEYAFPNRIDRSNYFKKLIKKSKISSANLMLAQILNSKSFSNTVFTTNFDDSIKKALDLMGAEDFFVAENTMDNLAINNQTKDIQIIHVHGTYNFYDCANLETEIDNVASQSGVMSSRQVLLSFLSNQAPIVVGYSGWENDVIMKCLKERLSQPTPLQYIWICYDNYSYTQLPDWIKKSDSVIFVVPENKKMICTTENDEKNVFDKKQDTIDATSFFRRIKSELKLPSPLIFSNPYSYYSNKINSILPEHEDVLHLRYWAKHLQILESNNSDFEKLFSTMETLYVKKDYVGARKTLLEIDKLRLSDVDVEFVCFSLIKDFILDEDVVNSFDTIYEFHIGAVEFIKNHFSSFKDKDKIIDILHLVMSIKCKDKKQYNQQHVLLDEINSFASKEKDLLEIELASLGMKSDSSDGNEKMALLLEIIKKVPTDTTNKSLIHIKFLALYKLSQINSPDKAIETITLAESLLNVLTKKIYKYRVLMLKSVYLFRISDDKIRESWSEEIIRVLSSENQKDNLFWCIEIISQLSDNKIEVLETVFDVKKIEKIVIKLIDNNNLNNSDCKTMLDYAKCCVFVCNISDDPNTKYKFCTKVIRISEAFPHQCELFSCCVFQALKVLLSLPNSIVSYENKNLQLTKIKSNPNTKSAYYNLLDNFYFSNNEIINEVIKEVSLIKNDIKLVEEECDEVTKGIELYCSGQIHEAEQLFIKLKSSLFYSVSQIAISNLLYMVRRGESANSESFLELAKKIDYPSPTTLMNILLYYIDKNATDNSEYKKTKEIIKKLSNDDLKEIESWWKKVDIVGEEESSLVLSIVNKEYKL